MSRFKTFSIWIVIAEVLLIMFANGLFYHQNQNTSGRIYLVEASRLVKDIKERSLTSDEIENMRLEQYESIVGIEAFVAGEACAYDYVVEEIDGKLYRIEYAEKASRQLPVYINASLMGMLMVTTIVLLYVYRKVLRPFHDMSNLSYELAKGNLSMPVKEEKSKLFGRFLWGMDMLREKLEDNKEKELAFQKERKTLILSLSHDIKTPLSSIELYAKALSENLYDSREEKEAALCGITKNVKEIKGYVDEIATVSREDFLNLEVRTGEFYLTEVMQITGRYYRDKLSVMHTNFQMDVPGECLVRGDKDRVVEVLQNVMENAIKYGDGRWIHIWTEEEEDCKLIRIENSGCSVKEEELPNLFDSFYRGSNCTGIKGSGLGLYICKTLMKKMDGEIFVETKEASFAVTVVIRKA